MSRCCRDIPLFTFGGCLLLQPLYTLICSVKFRLKFWMSYEQSDNPILTFCLSFEIVFFYTFITLQFFSMIFRNSLNNYCCVFNYSLVDCDVAFRTNPPVFSFERRSQMNNKDCIVSYYNTINQNCIGIGNIFK